MEKEKKTEVTVLKFKFGSNKSISIGSIPRLLCSGGKELQHINLQRKKPNQSKKARTCSCLPLARHWFSQKVSTLHLDVAGYIFHPVTKYHKLYSRITCRMRRVKFCSTLINIKMFAAVSSRSELRSLNSCIILIIERAVLTLQSLAILSAYPMSNSWHLISYVMRKATFYQLPNRKGREEK